GNQICGLYDLSPTKLGQVQNKVAPLTSLASVSQSNCAPSVVSIGSVPCGIGNFFAVKWDGRMKNAQVGGGIDAGRTTQDSCAVIDSPQQLLNCRVVTPLTANLQVKLFGSYNLPVGFIVSATFLNVAGPQILASYTATNAQILPSLGRNLGACGAAAVCAAT